MRQCAGGLLLPQTTSVPAWPASGKPKKMVIQPPWPEWIDDASPLDRLNERIQERIEGSGLGWLSLPHYRKRNILRAVILHPRCDEAVLDRILDEVRASGRELMGPR